jgi:hypothetical protein
VKVVGKGARWFRTRLAPGGSAPAWRREAGMNNTDDPLELPEILRRPPMTPEERRRLNRHVAHITARHLKNPPKRPKKSTRLLGPLPPRRKP